MSDLPTHFEIYKDRAGEWRWRILAKGNSKILADSAEGYSSRRGCFDGLRLVAEIPNPPKVWDTEAKKWVTE